MIVVGRPGELVASFELISFERIFNFSPSPSFCNLTSRGTAPSCSHFSDKFLLDRLQKQQQRQQHNGQHWMCVFSVAFSRRIRAELKVFFPSRAIKAVDEESTLLLLLVAILIVMKANKRTTTTTRGFCAWRE